MKQTALGYLFIHGMFLYGFKSKVCERMQFIIVIFYDEINNNERNERVIKGCLFRKEVR